MQIILSSIIIIEVFYERERERERERSVCGGFITFATFHCGILAISSYISYWTEI